MSGLNLELLENVHQSNGKTMFRCPACAESGADEKGEHGFISATGKFGCVMYPEAEGKEHRKRMFAIAGNKTERKKTPGKKKIHDTLDAASSACVWMLSQRDGKTYTETRRDKYHDQSGDVVAAVLRFENGEVDDNGKRKKTFLPVSRVDGGWKIGDPAGSWPLFRLHELTEGAVYVVEGEKAAAAGAAAGLNVTTSAHGAKSPRKTDWRPLAGRDVVLLPDNDIDGKAYADAVIRILAALEPAARCKVVSLPGLPSKGDLADFVAMHEGADIPAIIAAMVEGSPVMDAPEPDPEEVAKQLHGESYYVNERGTISVNEPYWSGLFAAENIVLHEPVEREFYRYDGASGLYLETTGDKIKNEVSTRMLKASEKWRVPDLARCRRDTTLNAIINHLRGEVEQRDAFSKREIQFVHLSNGIIVFRDGDADFAEFSPLFRSRNQSPIAFDADARCDRFLNELLLPAVHADDAVLIQKFAGLFLLGDNIIQRFLILDGTPGGGKSQLAIVLQSLVGILNCTQLRTEHLGERFEVFRFLKKTLLVGSDVPADFLNTKGASVLKSLVGGDILDGERKGHSGSFPIEGRFNVMVTSNSRLRVRLEGDVGAWRRRTTIVRYENPPPKKRIPDFGKLLVRDEGSGILNWCLVGLRELLADVAEIGDVRLTKRQSDVVESLMVESDSLRYFLKDQVEGAVGDQLTVNEIVEAYAGYCPSKGWNPLPITVIQRQLEGLMLELFHTVKSNSCGDSGKERGFRNVRLAGRDLV